MELRSFEVASSLQETAATHLSEKKTAEFVQLNLLTWETMANDWLSLAKDMRMEDVINLVLDASNRKIVSAVKIAAQMAVDLVEWMSTNHNKFALPHPYTGKDPKNVLTLLRFPKKTSLTGASWLEVEAREKFWASMDFNKNWNDNPDSILPSYTDRYTNPWFYSSMLPCLRMLVHVFFPDHLARARWEIEKEVNPFKFSTGAVQDACTNPVCKYFRTVLNCTNSMPLTKMSVDPVQHRDMSMYDELSSGPVMNWYLEEYPPEFQRWHHKHFPDYGVDRNHLTVTTDMPYVIKPMTVPKQMTSVRVIAPEDAVHSRMQLWYANMITGYWERVGLRASKKTGNKPALFVDTNQDVQRARCMKATSERLATIDCSAFSDTVRRDLIRLMDNRTLDSILDIMPTHIKWGSVLRRMEMVGTMGSPCTFPIEESIAGAGAIWSCKYAYLMGAQDSEPYRPGMVTVCGDDVMLPQWAAETFIDWLRAMSMIPNDDKSFTSGYYFESCGAESWCDEDVSPIVQWPRGIRLVDPKSDDFGRSQWDAYESTYKSPLSSVVDLGNRLYDAGFVGASDVLMDYAEVLAGTSLNRKDPTMANGTVHGASWPIDVRSWKCDGFVDVTRSLINAKHPGDRFLFNTIDTKWVPDEPKKACWCNGISSTAYEAFVQRYLYEVFLYNGPQFRDELDRLLGVSSRDETGDHARMRPQHVVRTTPT